MPNVQQRLWILVGLALTLPAAAGPLNPPPGPISSTGSTVQQVKDAVDAARSDIDAIRDDARIDVNSLGPISTARHSVSGSGSYVLTGNITVGGSQFTGILVSADNVTIDLNGFTISGDGVGGYGIVVSGARRNITIRNGVVRNFGLTGVSAGDDQHIVAENLTIENCGTSAIAVGAHSILRNVIARSSTSTGIVAGYGSTVADCISAENGSSGISVEQGSSVTGCVSHDNGSDGIVATNACMIRGNNCHGNTSDGIQGSNRNQIEDNTCDSNGLSTTVSGYGVNVTGGFNRIDGNHLSTNDAAVRFAGENNLFVRNTLANNGLLYAGTATGNLMGDITGFASDNPWANFALLE